MYIETKWTRDDYQLCKVLRLLLNRWYTFNYAPLRRLTRHLICSILWDPSTATDNCTAFYAAFVHYSGYNVSDLRVPLWLFSATPGPLIAIAFIHLSTTNRLSTSPRRIASSRGVSATVPVNCDLPVRFARSHLDRMFVFFFLRARECVRCVWCHCLFARIVRVFTRLAICVPAWTRWGTFGWCGTHARQL